MAIVLGISQFAKAQMDIGGGIALWGNVAIEAKADFSITDQISISPSIDYILVDENFDNYSSTYLMFNVDGHYNFDISDGFKAYPLVGLNYYYWTYSYDLPGYDNFSGDGGDVSINIGGGATYAISDSMKLYGELKFLRSDIGLSAGLLFSL